MMTIQPERFPDGRPVLLAGLRRTHAFAAALFLWRAPAAHAQAQLDTVLVESVASVLATDVARMGYKHRLEVEAGATAFDTAVTGRLRAVPAARLPSPPAGYREWIGTRGVTFAGDTAAVLVRFGTSSPPDGSLIDTYIEERRYLFVREASGWRFVRGDFLRGVDIGSFRG